MTNRQAPTQETVDVIGERVESRLSAEEKRRVLPVVTLDDARGLIIFRLPLRCCDRTTQDPPRYVRLRIRTDITGRRLLLFEFSECDDGASHRVVKLAKLKGYVSAPLVLKELGFGGAHRFEGQDVCGAAVSL